MFKGTYPHKIDAKGRLPVPAAFRRLLLEQGARGVVVTLMDQCVAAYPPAEWLRLENQLRALPAFSRQTKALTRLLAAHAVDCDMDVQGRILLPPHLRKTVGLKREAVVVGVLDRFEVWAPETWKTFLVESERLLDDVSCEVEWPLPGPATTRPVAPGSSGKVPLAELPQAKPKR